jgi:hypothetical protein
MASTSTNRRQGLNTGAAVKVPCKAATTANITLSGEQTIDGVSCVDGDRVLVKEQTTGANNGIYVVSTSTWQRDKDFDGTFDVVQGTLVPVANGTTNGGQMFRVTTANPITIGTTSLTFALALTSGTTSFTPYSYIASTTVQDAIEELVDDLAASDGASRVGFTPSGSGPTTTTVSAKLREYLTVDTDYSADRTGASSCVTAFQAAMTELSSRGGGKLYVRQGTYLFTITGDSNTIQIPSDVVIECEPGVIFKWGYWGAPLFAIVNKSNVKLKLNGAKFVWTGTFDTTSGTADKFSYGRAIPAYEWCAHIVSAGSSFVEIDGGQCAGDTTSNVQNVFVLFRGTTAGGLTEGNKVTNLVIDDVCQGVVWTEQKRFVIDGLLSDRYSNASDALYGPGHVLYVVEGTTASENGIIANITDKAGTALTAFTTGAQSVSLKALKNSTVYGIHSQRPEGAVNLDDLQDVSIEFRYHSSSTEDDTTGGVVYFIEPVTANKHVRIKGTIVEDAQRNFGGVNMLGITAGSKNLYCDVDITFIRAGDGTESVSAVEWVGNYGTCRIVHQSTGSGATRGVINVKNTSTDNNFYVRSLGAVPGPRVLVTSGSRNTFWCSGDSTVDYDTNEFAPSSGNCVIWEGARQYQSSKSLGSTTNPTTTFTLPQPGAYLVHMTLITSDANHARSDLFWVVFDNASVNDYTTAQSAVTAITKGASAPSAMSLAVDNAGVCTMTSTAGSNTWTLRYGYRQLSAD